MALDIISPNFRFLDENIQLPRRKFLQTLSFVRNYDYKELKIVAYKVLGSPYFQVPFNAYT